MKLHELSPAQGSTSPRYRKGRGPGSGNGKTAGKGHKGQNARSGGGVRIGFEGGQMPITRRLPKRGFTNVRDLNDFDNGATVGIEELLATGKIRKAYDGLRVLGEGELTKNLTVKAKAFTGSAKAKIEAAGGKVEVV